MITPVGPCPRPAPTSARTLLKRLFCRGGDAVGHSAPAVKRDQFVGAGMAPTCIGKTRVSKAKCYKGLYTKSQKCATKAASASIATTSPARLSASPCMVPRGERIRCRAAPLYPRAVTASATAADVANRESSVRDSNELKTLRLPLHPSAFQSTPRAASPRCSSASRN